MGCHPKGEEEPDSENDQKSESASSMLAVRWAGLIEDLLNVDSHWAFTQKEPVDCSILSGRKMSMMKKHQLKWKWRRALPFPYGLAEPNYWV